MGTRGGRETRLFLQVVRIAEKTPGCSGASSQRQGNSSIMPRMSATTKLQGILQTLSCSLFSWLTYKPQEFCHAPLHSHGCRKGQNSHPLCSGTFSLTQYDLHEAEAKLCILSVKLLGAQPFPLPWSSYKSFQILWLQSNENKTEEAQLIWLLSIMQWASEWL